METLTHFTFNRLYATVKLENDLSSFSSSFELLILNNCSFGSSGNMFLKQNTKNCINSRKKFARQSEKCGRMFMQLVLLLHLENWAFVKQTTRWNSKKNFIIFASLDVSKVLFPLSFCPRERCGKFSWLSE